MAYKLLALDLDDTLLDSDKKISGKNRDALKRAQAAGITVILSSGRAYPSVEAFNKELGIKGYTIACAGAQVIDANGEVVFSTYVPPIVAKQVMRWAALRNVHFQVYLDDGFYYLKRNPYSDLYEERGALLGAENPKLMEMEPVLSSKILFVDEPEKIEQYRKEIAAAFPDLQIQTSQADYLEVLNMDTSKSKALQFVADKLGISMDEVAAIGDSEIDVAMIESAGLGIAVANAIPDALRAADYVTASNEEDGVAKAIDKYILP